MLLDHGIDCASDPTIYPQSAQSNCIDKYVCSGLEAQCTVAMPKGGDHTNQCRGPNGPCDVAEFCDGAELDCPTDGVAAPGTECLSDPARFLQAAGDNCVSGYVCSGSEKDCTVAVYKTASYECRSADGQCDVAETCANHINGECPPDAVRPAEFPCTTPVGAIEPAGGNCIASYTCPGDGKQCKTNYKAADYVCRDAKTICDRPEVCGSRNLADCPADEMYPATAKRVCRQSGGVCLRVCVCVRGARFSA